MKHNYFVKHNGVLYAPGTDVPEGKAPEKVVEPKKEEVVKEEPKVEEIKYTRTQIQQMNSADLRKTAKSIGLDYEEDATNRELKQMIMGKLGI